MPSMLRRLWIHDTILCSAQVHTPSAQVLSFDRNSLKGALTDGKHQVKVRFSEDVIQRYEDKGILLEKKWGGIITLRRYSLCLDINLATKYAEFYFNIDDFVYHGGEGGVLTCSVVDVHADKHVQSKLCAVLQEQGILQGQEMVGGEQSGSMTISLVEGLGVQQPSQEEDVEDSGWSQDLGSTQASTQDTQELSSQCESGDTFVISASQQVEVHKLLKGSDLTATPSSPVTTSATPMDTAEGAVGESMPPGSDCVRDSIVHVSPSGSGELEAAGAGEGLQVPLQQALKGDDVTVVVEGSAEGTQSCIPPTKKLRREEGSGADGNRDQEVSEQGQKEKEEHDNADEFFISGSQVTALWGQGADQCSVLEEEIRLTPQENELVAFSSSLEGEEGDVEFVEDSSCSAPLMIDLMKDSTSPDADDKSLMVGNGRGSGEGCSKSDGQLAVQEGTSSEGALDRKEDAGVGATGGVKCVLAGDAEKDSRPVHTEELSSEAVQGKAGVRSDAIRDAKEAEAVATEEGDIDDGMRVEAAMDVEESSGREHTENDSDFFTAHSEVEVSSPLSNQDLCLSSKAFVAPDEKGTPTTTTNTTIVVVDLVCEETTPKISEGLSDISHVSDSNKSFSTAPCQSGSRAVEGSKEVQDKFKIIVPERSEPSSIAVSIMEQDTAESSQVHSQPSQNCTTSSSPSFTLITPDISLPAYQLPHSSCSSGTSLLTSTAPITSTTEDPAPRQRELLNKIVAYWRQRHLESPLSSDILCQFTASLDQQENTTVHRLRRRRRKRRH